MTLDEFLHWSIYLAASMLAVAAVCAAIRIVRGPAAPDRVVALDMLGLLGVSFTGLTAFVSGSAVFIDVALGVALIGFLATVAFAMFLERGAIQESEEAP
jgi:multisubunit Na+/H+ antiporter MnhF subunit